MASFAKMYQLLNSIRPCIRIVRARLQDDGCMLCSIKSKRIQMFIFSLSNTFVAKQTERVKCGNGQMGHINIDVNSHFNQFVFGIIRC